MAYLDKRTTTALVSLSPRIRALARYHVEYLRYYGIPAIITEGRRSKSRQIQLVHAGASQTFKSKHLRGLAYDLWFQSDNIPDSWWNYAGQVGEALGLRWGGRWQGFVDKPHFEL